MTPKNFNLTKDAQTESRDKKMLRRHLTRWKTISFSHTWTQLRNKQETNLFANEVSVRKAA